MATSSNLRSRVTDIVTCPICLELYDQPKCLPCLHTFCLKCIQGHCRDKLPDDEVPCPLCRENFKIPLKGLVELKNNFFVQSLVDARKTSIDVVHANGVPCEVCAEETSGDNESNIPESTVYCVDCKQKMCERCSVPHRRWRGGPHKVIPLGSEFDSGLVEARRSYCDKHRDEPVKLYCVTCHENICLMCSAIEHDQHKRREISKVADEFVSKIDTNMIQVTSRIGDVRKSISVLGECCDSFMKDSKNIETAVKQKGEEIKLLVDRQVNSLLEELESVKHEACKETDSCKERLQLLLLGMESFNAYWLELKSKGKPSDITRVGNELNTRATVLMQTDIAVAIVMPQIEFLSENMGKLEIGFIDRTCIRRSEPARIGPGSQNVKCDDQRLNEQCSRSHTIQSIETSPAGDQENFHSGATVSTGNAERDLHAAGFGESAHLEVEGATGKRIYRPDDFNVKGFPGGNNRQQLPKPSMVSDSFTFKSDGNRLPDEEINIYEKLSSILDGLSPKTFNYYPVRKVLIVHINNTEERLRSCADMIFEKAVDNPNVAVIYAKLVKCMLMLSVPSRSDPRLCVGFRSVFLNKCQQEFEKATTHLAEIPRGHHYDLLLSRSIGVARLIGELFNLRILAESIMHDCLLQLLSQCSSNEGNLKIICQLLTTVGPELDRKGARINIDSYFRKFKAFVADSNTSDDIRHILLDLIDLRKNGWIPRKS